MRAEAPNPPVGVKIHTREYANWRNSLSLEDQARVWVEGIWVHIDFFRTQKNIDLDRAIRGTIVSDICGDSVGQLCGVSQSASVKKGGQDLLDGLKLTWMSATLAVAELGDYLPRQTKEKFQQVFAQYQRKVEETCEGQTVDYNSLYNLCSDLYVDIQAVGKNPPGMKESDLGYAVEIIFKNVTAWRQFIGAEER